jgi:hypothetical protein
MLAEVIMKNTSSLTSLGKWVAGGAGVAAALYAGYAGLTWYRYGRRTAPGETDPLLDVFMPVYDVIERHHTRVHAPAEVTLAAAVNTDINDALFVRAIFKARELVLGAEPADRRPSHGFLAQMKSVGWGVLGEVPDREIVMGAVTEPWAANPVFRTIPAAEFAAFAEPGYVKIAWTLGAEPLGPGQSLAATETRAVATDPVARARFRRYWAFVSPGVILIRRAMLRQIKTEAERRACLPTMVELTS